MKRPVILIFVFVVLAVFFLGMISAADYYVDPVNGDDANPGTIDLPWKTTAKAIQAINPGDILYFREGIYRLTEEPPGKSLSKSGASATNFITIQAYPGERAVILGSFNTEGKIWEQHDSNVWRMKASFLTKDPTGMFKFVSNHKDSKRIPHKSWLGGTGPARKHDNVTNLIEGTWTKAHEDGSFCMKWDGSTLVNDDNANCYIYYYPPTGENPNNEIYELSQRGLTRITTDYTVVKNLEIYYTQSQPIFFEGADYILLEGNTFGHVSNGNDNSYGMRIWNSGGSVVRNNIVFDSVYWGGVSNSKGITFMVSDIGNPNIVEYNEIYDIPGYAAVGVKSGVSDLIVRYNYIHDVFIAFESGGYRCADSSACSPEDSKYRPGGNWTVYGNIVVNATSGFYLPGHLKDGNHNKIFNNVFYGGTSGIVLGWRNDTGDRGSYGNLFANNIFIKNKVGFYLNSGGHTTIVEDYLDQFESDNNLFFENSFADVHLRPNWGGNYYSGTPYSLTDFQASFNRESNSISADPLFVNLNNLDLHLQDTSPAKNAGDGSFYGLTSVDIGAYPTGDVVTNPVPIPEPAEEPTEEPTLTNPGDVDDDESVTFDDILIILRHIIRLQTDSRADVNGDGVVNIFDIIKIARYLGTHYGADSAEPMILSHRPLRTTLPSGTTETVFGVETDERAACRYSNNGGTDFSLMASFQKTGGTFHASRILDLTDGETRTYYVKCRDEAGNENTGDYVISFSVAGEGGEGEVGSGSSIRDNEPIDFIMITERSFDSLEENGWGYISYTSPDNYKIVSDVSAPYSPNNIGQITYVAGRGGGGEPAKTYVNWNPSKPKKLYVSSWIKLSDNWQGHDTLINKLFYAQIGEGNVLSRFFLHARGANSGTLSPCGMTQGTPLGDQRLLCPNLGSANIERGMWHQYELLLVDNTGDNYDGEYHLWVDGVKVAEYKDIIWTNGTERKGWRGFEWTPIWGGIGDVIEQEQYMWMDHVYISGKEELNLAPEVNPVVNLNFDSYATTEEFRADCDTFDNCAEDKGINSLFLDDGVGYSPYSSTKSMRYEWLNQGCTSHTKGRGVDLPQSLTEMWVEVPVKWSASYTACNIDCVPCSHKLVFGQVRPDLNYRWALIWQSGGGTSDGPPVYEAPANSAGVNSLISLASTGSAKYHDNEWHLLRLHWKHSTTEADSDGMYEFWIDGKLIDSIDGIAMKNDLSTRAILLGRNKDKGLNEGLEEMWIGGLRVYAENPGW